MITWIWQIWWRWNQNTEQAENRRCRKTMFNSPKEKGQNADFLKPALNKIIISDEKCIKYNFESYLKFASGFFI